MLKVVFLILAAILTLCIALAQYTIDGWYDLEFIVTMTSFLFQLVAIQMIVTEERDHPTLKNSLYAKKIARQDAVVKEASGKSYTQAIEILLGERIIEPLGDGYNLTVDGACYLSPKTLGFVVDTIVHNKKHFSEKEREDFIWEVVAKLKMTDYPAKNFVKKYVGRKHRGVREMIQGFV